MNKMRLIQFKDDLLPLLVLFILPIIYLSGALFSANNLLGTTATDITVEAYSKSYGYNELSKFSIPLWNPYRFSGMPYVATLHPAIFYPLNLIFLILPVNLAINWSIVLHLFLSGVFTFYLLKHYGISRFGSAVAGIVYMFSAPHIMHIYAGHFIVLNAMVWTPLMFLFLDRMVRGDGLRYGIFLSITVALQLLAGQPQYLFYSMIALLLYLFLLLFRLRMDGTGWGRMAAKGIAFAGFILLGLALSAIQILPTIEMTKYSTRENLSYEWVSIFSFPPENLITYLIPDFFGDMLKVPYWGKNYLWEMTAYIGIIPLTLAVVAIFYDRRKVVWFFGGLATASAILAMGKYTPLLELLYTYVPGFNLFRGNSKFIFLNALSLAILSGFGADAVCRRSYHMDTRFRAGIIWFSLFLTSGLIIIYSIFDESWFRWAINQSVNSVDFFKNPASVIQRGFEVQASASFKNGAIRAAAYLIAGGAILFLSNYDKLKEKVLMPVLLAVIIFDLFSFGMRYMLTFDNSGIHWDKETLSFLKQDKEPFRVVAPEMDANSGMAAGIETLGGYDTIMVKRYSEFINFSQGYQPDPPKLSVKIETINKMTNLLNAKYLVLRSGRVIDNPAFQFIFDNGHFSIYKNINALPRAFVVHAAKVVGGRNDIFRELTRPDFDPTAYAIIEEDIHMPLKRPASPSPIPRFLEYSPNRVIIDAYSIKPGLLVLGDVYYPGWKALVDGKEAKIYKANYVMRAVALPEGRHKVEFIYTPLYFKIGATISLMTLVSIIGFFVREWRMKIKK